MSIPQIIPVMKFDLVKAAIATVLVNERDAQNTLLTDAGKTVDQIDNDYYFNVFKDLYRLPDASELPCVNVYNAGGNFGGPMGKSYADSKWHTYNLAVDCYSVSTAETGGARADKLAAERLDYLWAQTFHALGSEENWHKGLADIVRVARFTSWEQKLFAGSEDTASAILAIQATLELQFEEPTEMLAGVPLEDFAFDLEIDEQFISPFVTVSI